MFGKKSDTEESMKSRYLDRLLLAVLGVALVGSSAGALSIRTVPERVEQPAVGLEWAGENYRELIRETDEPARAGNCTDAVTATRRG